MNFEWFIAKRYLWSKRRHPFAGVMATISVIGICVGVAALIVVLAVMNGFDEDLKARIIGMRAHLTIEKDGEFGQPDVIIREVRRHTQVAGVSAFVEGQALVQVGQWGAGVLIRGIDTKNEKSVSKFYQYLSKGTLSDRADGVVIGSELAHRANLQIGSQIQIATQNTRKPFLATVEGIFSSGMYDYDANLVFLNLANAQNIFDLKQGVSGISVSLKNPDAAERARRDLSKMLGYPFYVRTWMDLNRTLFSALALEKAAMFVILALIIFVACLNIAGSLTIIVMDKTRDIGVLKAIGVRPSQLLRIFGIDGAFLGLVGAGVGFCVGMGVCLVLKNYKFITLPKDIYYGIDRLPVSINIGDTLLVLTVAVFLSFVSALYPAYVASKLDPIKALRYE